MPGFVFKTDLKETDPDKQSGELVEILNMLMRDIKGVIIHPNPNDKTSKPGVRRMRSGNGHTESGYFVFEYIPGSPFSTEKKD